VVRIDQCDTIYGVNLNDNITPVMVRDAIIKCFYEADDDVLDNLFQISTFKSIEDEKDTKLRHVNIMIKKMFRDIDGDFYNPTKKSLINVIDKCAEYAKYFRDKEIIEKHYKEIMTLINKLD
jgi:hypothetical protein